MFKNRFTRYFLSPVLAVFCLFSSVFLFRDVARSQPADPVPPYQCFVAGKNRTFVVDQLDREAGHFEMAIYEQGSDVHDSPASLDPKSYRETVDVTFEKKPSGDNPDQISGGGRSLDGEFRISAWWGGPYLAVSQSAQLMGAGPCDVFWQMDSARFRRQVRESMKEDAIAHPS